MTARPGHGDRRAPFAATALGEGRHDVVVAGRRLTLAVYRDVAVFAPEGGALVTEIDLLAHAGDHAGEAAG